jgi:hypothetical protein
MTPRKSQKPSKRDTGKSIDLIDAYYILPKLYENVSMFK